MQVCTQEIDLHTYLCHYSWKVILVTHWPIENVAIILQFLYKLIVRNSNWWTRYEIALTKMPLTKDLINEKSENIMLPPGNMTMLAQIVWPHGFAMEYQRTNWTNPLVIKMIDRAHIHLFLAWMNNYIRLEITYPFPNFNDYVSYWWYWGRGSHACRIACFCGVECFGPDHDG